jgi:hypothetical protein
MKKLGLATAVLLLSYILIGCAGGIPQEQYDNVKTQLENSQKQVALLQSDIKELEQKYEIIGETPVETAENIVKRYHETHIYTEYDFFVCADMALDVWDMCKAQGINAIIKVGNVETEAKNITEANHAWVLAETNTGKYLALETTGGYAVWGDDNPLYYQGWSFDNPKEYKRWVELKQEYNIRVQLIAQSGKDLESTRQKGLDAANQLSILLDEIKMLSIPDPLLFSKIAELNEETEKCGEFIGRMNQLNELMSQQAHELDNIISEMKGLTS